MPKRYLITGGAGFIGSNFVERILDVGATRVVTVDVLTYAGSLDNLAFCTYDARHRFVKADVRDEETLLALMRAEVPDCIVHFAAESHVDRSIAHAKVFESANVAGTVALLEATKRYLSEAGERVKNFRFVHISTDEVYGDLPIDDTVTRFKENAPLRPSSPYAASKAAADMFVLSYARTYHLPAIIVRMCNNYGPRQHAEKFIPKMIECACEGKPLPVYGTGENVREWLHVSDACRAIELIARKGRVGQTYNVSSNDAFSNNDVAHMVIDAVYAANNGNASAAPMPRIEYAPDRLGHDRRYAIDATKIKRELGWSAKIPLEQGLQAVVQTIVAH